MVPILLLVVYGLAYLPCNFSSRIYCFQDLTPSIIDYLQQVESSDVDGDHRAAASRALAAAARQWRSVDGDDDELLTERYSDK